MNHYYAVFKKTSEAIEVEFPDLEGCATFGGDWEEALANAEDVLAGWLAHAEPEFINKPSKYDQLNHVSGELVPIPVNENIKNSYQEVKRFNVIFPRKILTEVDAYRKSAGLKRSTFLQKAAVAYLQQHHK
jgi:predicted RNase H-like HicB family nuclease